MHHNTKVRVGVVGCGNISNAYFKGLSLFPDLLEVAACADLDPARAKDKADEWQIGASGSLEEVLENPDVDLIVNLTVPRAHAPVNLAALKKGKNVYCEKPFALSSTGGREVLEMAKRSNLLVGTAPDTFLGAGLQTCRKLIDDGTIGVPVAATAFMACHGHEGWHPNPEFYYAKGGGPLFDMGPYYLTALVTLMGPVARVSASARITFPTRTITSQPLKGKQIKVETPTHYSGTLDFANGAVATVIMSFDVWKTKLPMLEIYGTEGSLACPDPNHFDEGGSISVFSNDSTEWRDVPLIHSHRAGRGIGVADMAMAMRSMRPHRCTGELGCHVIEVMEAFGKSSESNSHIEIKSSCKVPEALPAKLETGEID